MEHPYVPRDMELPGFVPQIMSRSALQSVFFAVSALIVSTTWILSGFSKKLSKCERTVMCWWIFTGLAHMILEGYFTFTPDFYKKTPPFYLDEICKWPRNLSMFYLSPHHVLLLQNAGKEYSRGDSRYASRDSAVVSAVGLTAVLAGPLSLLCVFAIATKKSYRHVLQLAVSIEQIYATILLFITYYLDGNDFATSHFYFYGDFLFGNSIWIVIPTAISVGCWRRICAAIQEQGEGQKRKTKLRR